MTRLVQFSFLFAVMALLVDTAFGVAGDARTSETGTGVSETATGKLAGSAPLSHHEGEEALESDGPGKGKAEPGTRKGAFSDSDGTGWNYCSGKCSMRNEKIEVKEDSGYFNIGNDAPKNYSLRCCEED